LRRIPITLRLAIAFTGVMAVVFVGLGLLLYDLLGYEIEETVDAGLRSRADDVAALVRQPERHLEGDRQRPSDEESLAEVIDEHGKVIDATSNIGDRPLLTAEQLARARDDSMFTELKSLPGVMNNPVRLRASPVEAGGRNLVIVVGASLEERADSQEDLRKALFRTGPLALLLAGLAGYGVARAALRPVESMRRRAAAVSAAEPGKRLPVPATRDEVSRLGTTLNEMLARLENALARERTFVSDASHELRTPLAILKTELELALREGRSVDELREAVRSAAEETDRLVQLAEDLLVIARTDQGRLPVRRTRSNVGDVLENVTERFSRRAGELGRALETERRSPVTALADPLRLEQALGNMVDNALRYGNGPVRLSVQERNGSVELHVVDEGNGFPPAFLGRAFERFSRADDARSRGGSGLGLAVVEAIARAHGGSAHAANRPSGGADVWVALPASPEPERH
jgi:two-component system, OmpR family, sensor kinase